MTDLIDLHIEAWRRLRRQPSTLAERERILRSLPCPPESLTREIFDPWWIRRQTKEDGGLKAARSVATDLSHLKTFYHWAVIEKHILVNPVDHASSPSLPKSRPRPTKEPDLKIAVKAANPMLARMIALGALAGLRSAEIAHLDWDDVDLTSRMLWVRHGKGDKDRSVPIGTTLATYLGAAGTGRVVTSNDGEPLSPKAVSSRINRHMRSLGLNTTAHKLRARYATTALEKSGNLILVKDLLGHASVATTQLYLLASNAEARALADAVGDIG